ncbi:MAG TPA: ATP-binding protein [Mycobacteriales bacterium]|nr:ATP-binding protein [Mycobacteriales bacterium]
MSLTPRHRVIIVCVLVAAAGYYARDVFHGIERSLNCDTTVVRAAHACRFGASHLSLSRVLLAGVMLIVFAVVVITLTRWALRPVADLTAMVSRLGPQNLAERMDIGAGGDEVSELAMAIDQMLDRLAAGYEGQRSFAANASHELRTPLAVQRTLIEVSMAQARSPAQIALLTDQLLATNERNERLIEGLLVLSESDRGLAARTPQRLDGIVGLVIDTHRDLAAKAGVTLEPQLTECMVLGERVLLERLVINLVRNAIIYNPAGGEVAIAVGGTPTLVVENTGAEIPAESIAGLFEPFRRGTVDRTHHGGGAGLGLTIVRSICQAHHGTVDARPGLRGGLRIEISLPPA